MKQNVFVSALDGFLRKVQTRVDLTKYDLCAALNSFTKARKYRFGLQIHAKVVQDGHADNLVLNSALVDFYAKCGAVEKARRVFDGMDRHDEVSWTSMIWCYSQRGFGVEAFVLFKRMLGSDIRPNCFTYVGVIAACTELKDLHVQGSLVHAHAIKLGFVINGFVVSALVDCYSKYGRVDEAVSVFHAASTEDNIVYNSMISGYCQNMYYDDALRLFVKMREEGLNSTHFTLSSVLNACGRLSVLQLGRQLHCLVMKLGFATNVFVMSSLIDMYSKSGSVDEASCAFKQTKEKNSVIWTSMVSGYAQSGQALEALHVFDQMVDEGFLPDHICFTAALTACNHSGFLERAVGYFEKMRNDYDLVPTLDQYACLIDLYARKGQLIKAMELMEKMPYDPNCVVLSSVLTCCKIHGSVETGREIANQLFELEPHNAAAYLTMTHIYADAGLQDEVTNIRKLMKQKVTTKSAAWSWIEVDGNIEVFLVGDVSHHMSDRICLLLERLNMDVRDSRSFWNNYEYDDAVSCC
ncbi:hypothetical protein vseg_002330 [Gypsophila vaccaria]